MASSAKSIDDVLADELEEIRKRRDVCGLLPSAEAEGPSGESEPEPVDSTDPRSRIRHSLVGVALSGGGVRAAAFSLGFLQALYKAGRMRFVDYLSTVSGGGYAGALFSSEAARFNGDIDWSREGNQNRLPIDVDSTGRQADRIRGLALHGRMMGNFVRLFSRHLWGFILINTFIISGIFAVASLMAFVMRLPWSGFALPVLAELKFSTDITVPFFWTFIALLVWLLCQGIAVAAKVLRKPIPPLTQYSYLLLIATIGLGVVTMLAIGDFGLSSWITNFGLSPVVEQRANQVLAWVTTIAGGLFATTLLPYVMPRTLLRSGGSRRGTPKSFIFHASGYALVFGAPLFVFYFLAHENLSGHNETRDNVDTLTSSHLRLPERFVRHLESQSLSEEKTDRDVSRQLLAAMNNNFTADQLQQQAATPRIPERQAAIKDLIDSIEEKKRNDKNISFFPRLLQAVAYPMGLDSEFAGRVQANKDRLAYVAQMADRINVNCLSDPRFLTKQLTEPPVPAPPPNDAEAQTERAVEPPSRASEEGPDHKELLTSLGLVDEQTEPLDSGRLIDALGELRSAHHHVRTITGKKDGTITIGAYAVALRNVGGVELAPEAEMSSKNIAAVMRAHDYRLGQLLCEIDDVLSRAQVDSALRERIQREHVRLTVLPHVQESQFNVVDIVQQVKHRIAGTKVKSKRELLLDRLVEEHYPAGVSTEDQLKDIQVAHDRLRDLLREIRENNWIVLAALYPNNIASQQTIFARVVNASDQRTRLKIAFYSLLVCLLVGVIANLNRTCLHGVYRDQIGEIWLPRLNMKLSELDTCSKGAPLHLFNGTVNRMGNRNDPDNERRSRFTMTRRFCGTNKVGYRNTREYQRDSVLVADAIAISGAAVTSTNVEGLLLRVMLFLTNFRLGQWLRNPSEYLVDHYWPSPLLTLINLLWYPEQRRYLFISDGGHLDNTGLAGLLERRCRLMFFADATYDPNYEFTDIRKLLQAARAKYGIRVRSIRFVPEAETNDEEFDVQNIGLAPLSAGEEGFNHAHFAVVSLTYPEGDDATLIIAKSSLTGDEVTELIELKRQEGSVFPHDPTSDQFLPPDRFEAYTELGRHIGGEIDRYVGEGGIDAIAQTGFCSQHAELDAADGDDASNSDESTTTVATAGDRAGADLASPSAFDVDREFDAASIELALGELTTLAQRCRAVATADRERDSDLLQVISSWSRDRGGDATRPLRQQFCQGLFHLVDTYGDELKANREYQLQFLMMLELLGHNIAGVRRAVLDLLTAEASATETSDG